MAIPDVKLDKLAIVISGLCLLHCLAIPVAALLLPAAGRYLDASETTTHWVLLALAVPVSIAALWAGFRRHRYAPAAKIGGAGMALMLLAVVHVGGIDVETPLTVIGVTLLGTAHGLNARLTLRSHAHRVRSTVRGQRATEH